ncbi:MAG: sigma-70 family RNA polymerase sigma factor [Planctomycetaceae bacterium]|nr:sigma-70 family RNA polymerase sigma factor [Planctomycetaceae bacterium]
MRSRLREPEAVDDVMQNIAMAIVRQKQMLDEVNRVGAWLYQVAVRQVLMYRRTTGRKRKLQDRLNEGFASPVVDRSIATPEQRVIAAETQQNVRNALDQLTELDRQILMLKYEDNWSYRELADLLGVKEDTIEYRLTKARKNLRCVLTQMGEGGSECP